MRRVWIVGLVACAACGSPRPLPPPIIASAVPRPDADLADADLTDAAWIDECSSETLASARGELELATCHIGDHSTSERAAADGFVEHEMRADLTLHVTNGSPLTSTITTWTNGWEWGSGWKLAGVLASASGDEVVLLIQGSDGPSPGISAMSGHLHGYAWKAGAWTEVYDRVASTLEIAMSTDQQLATLSSCQEATTPSPPGCGNFVDGEPGPTIELRWDGATVSETVLPPTPQTP